MKEILRMTPSTYAMRALLAAAVVTCAFLVAASPAWANTINVNSLADTVADNDNDCTLREAITNANADDQSGSDDCPAGDGADTITFSVNGTITLAFSADLPTITDDLTINGPGAANLTIRQDDFSQINSSGVLAVADDVTLNVRDITIANGATDAPAGFGGGIGNSGTLNVTDSAFSENSAGFGGGIYNSGMLDVTGSTFSGNGALDGGGIFNAGGTATVTNSTFAGNMALDREESGGGIYNADGGTFEVTNSTLSSNSAQVGANVFNDVGTTTLRNTIVANPQSGGSCSGTVVDGGGNLDDGSTCAFTNPLSQSNTPAGLDSAGLADNGGPTQTIALVPGSAAIDMGVDATCETPPVNNRDQRGVGRPRDGDGNGTATCDIGAFELNRPPVAINDPYSVSEDQTLTVNAPGVLINDTDANGDDLSAMVVTGPQNASSFSLNPDGSFSYTPDPNFEGSDAFTYKASDGANDSNEAMVVISVRAVNDAPTANDDTDQTERNTSADIDVVSNDLDIDGDRLTVTSADSPTTQGGTTQVLTNNKVRYTPPDEDFIGTDSFEYTIEDPSGQQSTATVTVEVGDTGAPSVVKVSPKNARDTASSETKVKATFSEKIDPATLDETTFTLIKDGNSNPVSATVSLDSSGKKAILDPDKPLEPNATYTARIKGESGGVADPSGNELIANEVWYFGVNSAPLITYPRPSPDSIITTRTPFIEATVTDAQTDLRARNITLSVDGNNISTFTYNARIDRLEYKVGSDLSLGKHKVRISAEDAQGMRTTRTWTFEVVQ